MLQIDENLFEIDDLLDELISDLLAGEEARAYSRAKLVFEADASLQKDLTTLTENASYISGRKDLRELQKEVNLNEKAYGLRLAENDLQALLSKIIKDLTESVSSQIRVNDQLPFGESGHHGNHGHTLRGVTTPQEAPKNQTYQARVQLYIYYRAYPPQGLEKYGRILYGSPRYKYECLSVEAQRVEVVIAELKKSKLITQIKRAHLTEMTEDFHAAFFETNEHLKKLSKI